MRGQEGGLQALQWPPLCIKLLLATGSGSAQLRGLRRERLTRSHDPRDRPWSSLPISHLLSDVLQQPSVAFVHATQQPAELDQKTGVFAGAAPGSLVRRLAFREIGQLRRFLALVEELIEGDLKCAGHFLQRLDRGNCMAVLNAGDVTTEKASALLDVPLGKFSFFSKRSQTVADNHCDFFPQ